MLEANELLLLTSTMQPRQLARLFGALCFEERLLIIGALISAGEEGMSAQEIAEITELPLSAVPIHIEYMASTDMVKVRQGSTGKLFSADLPLLEELFKFMTENYGAGLRKNEIEAPAAP